MHKTPEQPIQPEDQIDPGEISYDEGRQQEIDDEAFRKSITDDTLRTILDIGGLK